MARRKEKKEKSEKMEKNRKSISKERRQSKDRKVKAPKERRLSKDRKTKDDIKMSKLREKYKDFESLGESVFDGAPKSLLDATWNRLSDMEENLHVVLDVREDLMEQVMKECQERYIAKQAIKFHVHCAYRALMDLFGTLYLVRDPGPEAPWSKRLRPLEAPPPQPNLGDSWATGVLRRAPLPPHGKTEERQIGQFGSIDVPTYEGSRGPPTPPLLQPFDATLIRHEDESGVVSEPPAPPPSMVMLSDGPSGPTPGADAGIERDMEREERRKKRPRTHHKRPPRSGTPKHGDGAGPSPMSAGAAAAMSVATAPRRPGSSMLAIEETLRQSRISVSRLPGDRVPVFALLKEQKRRSTLDPEEAEARKDLPLDPTVRRELGVRLSASGIGAASKTPGKQHGVRHVRYRKPAKSRHEVVPPPTPTGPQPFRPPSPDFQVAPPRPLPHHPTPPPSLQHLRKVTPVEVPATVVTEPPPPQPEPEKKKLPQKIPEEPESSSSTDAPTDYDSYKSDPRMVKKHLESADYLGKGKSPSMPARDISDTRLFRRPSDRRTQRVEERAAQLDMDLDSGGGSLQMPAGTRGSRRSSRGRGRLSHGARPSLDQQQQRDSSPPRSSSPGDTVRGLIDDALSRMGRSIETDPRDFRRQSPEAAAAGPPAPEGMPSQGPPSPEDVDRPLEKLRDDRITDHSDEEESSSDRDLKSTLKQGDQRDSRELPKDTPFDSRRGSRGRKGSSVTRDSRGRKDSADRISEELEDEMSSPTERPDSSDRSSRKTKDSGGERPLMDKTESADWRSKEPIEDKSPRGPVRLSFTPTPRDKVSEGERERVKAAAERAVDAAVGAAKWLLSRPSFQNMERGKAVKEAREALRRALEAAADVVSQLPSLLPARLSAAAAGSRPHSATSRGSGSRTPSPKLSAVAEQRETLLPSGVPPQRKPATPKWKGVDEGRTRSDPCLRCPRIEEKHECPEKHEGKDMLCECSDESVDMHQEPAASVPREEKRTPPAYHHHKHHHRKEGGEEHLLAATDQVSPVGRPEELLQAATTRASARTPSIGTASAPPPGKVENVRPEAKRISSLNEKSGKMDTSRKMETRGTNDTSNKSETHEQVPTADENETAGMNATLLQKGASEQGAIPKNKIVGTPVTSASTPRGTPPGSKQSSP